MKLVTAQLSFFFRDTTVRRNTKALLKIVALLLAVIATFSVAFHYLMALEGQEHSWLTGLYWTLTVMSTLGFGDITFASDLGRLFSIVVMVSGVVLLLIVLPFAFIQFFYAPWLEAQIHLRAPRELAPDVRDHVILCDYDLLAPGLIARLTDLDVPYVIVEPDPARAGGLASDGLEVVTGPLDAPATYHAVGADRARLVVANREDTVNANITLTVREVAPDVPIIAFVSADESEDVLQLCGATHVLPLKRQLGEHLANRVTTTHAHAHVIGRYGDLLLAELPVRRTPLAGRTVRDTRLRETTGVSVVGTWERGRFVPATPDLRLSDTSVPVLIGTEAQFAALDDLLLIYNFNPHPVLILGGGRVGRAAARVLAARETPVTIVEKDPVIAERARKVGVTVVEGDAADLDVIEGAGVSHAPSVLLTTHDDAVNVFLAAYCRRLNPSLRIVSRITHERNMESVHRAGADLVLSFDALGVSAIVALMQGQDLTVLGEGLDLFTVPVPRKLAGKTLAESGIGAKTGLLVIGVTRGEETVAPPPPGTVLPTDGTLAMLGSAEQHHRFAEAFD